MIDYLKGQKETFAVKLAWIHLKQWLLWRRFDFWFVSICRDDSAEVDVYNPQKNEWDKISPMTQVCISHLTLVCSSALLAIVWDL